MIDLYRLPLDLPPWAIDALWNDLSSDEQQRAGRYLVADARRRFIAGRGQLRAVLGAALGCAPAELRFDSLPNGKPFLLACASQPGDGRMVKRQGLSFNLSHSAELGLLAVDPTGQRELGIDLEHHRPDVPFLRLAERFFAPHEADWLAALPEGQQMTAFYRLWTRKEALLKLTGVGISGGLNAYIIPTGPEEQVRVETWTLLDLHPAEGFSAALAVDGDLPGVRWLDPPAAGSFE